MPMYPLDPPLLSPSNPYTSYQPGKLLGYLTSIFSQASMTLKHYFSQNSFSPTLANSYTFFKTQKPLSLSSTVLMHLSTPNPIPQLFIVAISCKFHKDRHTPHRLSDPKMYLTASM